MGANGKSFMIVAVLLGAAAAIVGYFGLRHSPATHRCEDQRQLS